MKVFFNAISTIFCLIAVIDELDNDLHPHLIPLILDWFRFKETNPKQARLIFSCHTPEILNRLQKHQIYICEKSDQQSFAWRVDQIIGIRADDNLYAKYMAGVLGGIPEFLRIKSVSKIFCIKMINHF